jgi:hypothetical protein
MATLPVVQPILGAEAEVLVLIERKIGIISYLGQADQE